MNDKNTLYGCFFFKFQFFVSTDHFMFNMHIYLDTILVYTLYICEKKIT